MAVTVPVNPDLLELWNARSEEPVLASVARRSIATLFIWIGLFVSGIGTGGVYALMTTSV